MGRELSPACGWKIRHATLQDANDAIRSMRRRRVITGGVEDRRGQAHAYHCRVCGDYHVGHIGRGTRAAPRRPGHPP